MIFKTEAFTPQANLINLGYYKIVLNTSLTGYRIYFGNSNENSYYIDPGPTRFKFEFKILQTLKALYAKENF